MRKPRFIRCASAEADAALASCARFAAKAASAVAATPISSLSIRLSSDCGGARRRRRRRRGVGKIQPGRQAAVIRVPCRSGSMPNDVSSPLGGNGGEGGAGSERQAPSVRAGVRLATEGPGASEALELAKPPCSSTRTAGETRPTPLRTQRRCCEYPPPPIPAEGT